MRRLSKRWESAQIVEPPPIYRTYLPEAPEKRGDAMCWACIEYPDIKGPFRLEIWDNDEREWDEIDHFSTLKQAKEVGRLLAGIALNKNI